MSQSSSAVARSKLSDVSNFGVVALGLLLGRFLGFVREILLARTFGVSAQADTAVLVLTIPDLFTNILMGGALGAVLVPLLKRQPSQTKALFWQSNVLFGGVMLVLAGLYRWYATPLLALLAPGVAGSHQTVVVHFLAITIWVMPLTFMAGITRAWLQAQHRFSLGALGTAVYNLALIAALVFAVKDVTYLAYAALFGAAGRWLMQYIGLAQRLGMPGWQGKWLIDRQVMLRYWHAMLAGSVVVFLPAIARAVASLGQAGSIALINYVTKLVELPLALCLSVFSVVLFPRFASLFAAKATVQQGIALAERVLQWIWVLAWAIVGVCVVFAHSIVHAVYGWSMPAHMQQISQLFTVAMLALPAQGVSALLIAVFNAKLDTRTPFRISIFAVISFIGLAYQLAQVLNLIGVITALVVTYWGIVLAQLWGLRQVLCVRRAMFNVETWRALGVIVVLCGASWILPKTLPGLIISSAVVGVCSLSCLGSLRAYVLEWRR